MLDHIHEPNQRLALGMILEPAVLRHARLAQKGIAFVSKLGLERAGELVILDPVIADIRGKVVLNIAQ